jgi:hypothetical protein
MEEAMLYEIEDNGRHCLKNTFNRPDALFRWRSGRGNTAKIVVTTPEDEARPLPTDPHDFFSHLSEQYANCDWRIRNDTIMLAVPHTRMGYWIGKGGGKIRAIREHLDRKIEIIPAEWHEDYDYMPGDVYLEPRNDPTHGFALVGGYIAPWHLNELLDVNKKIVEKTHDADMVNLKASKLLCSFHLTDEQRRTVRQLRNEERETREEIELLKQSRRTL